MLAYASAIWFRPRVPRRCAPMVSAGKLYVMNWAIPDQLAQARRPGYRGERLHPVGEQEVDAWIREVKANRISSIICLLSDRELAAYDMPGGLLAYYRAAGFRVEHIPIDDYKIPALSAEELRLVAASYNYLPKPVLIHCSAGVGRTNKAVKYIAQQVQQGG